MTGRRQNFSRSRVRLRPDFDAIARSISRPGIDPRAWLAYARIDDDEDAVVWDNEHGWYVDATITGGPLAGAEILARVGLLTAGGGRGRYAPPERGGLIVVAIPNGDPNDEPVAIAALHTNGELAPTSVNGRTIVERDAGEDEIAAAETYITVAAGEDDEQEWRRRRVATSGQHALHGDTMELGVQDADQPFMRGDDFRDAIDALGDAIEAAFSALTTGGSTSAGGVPLTAAQDALGTPAPAPPTNGIRKAVQDLKDAADAYLSARIMGD